MTLRNLRLDCDRALEMLISRGAETSDRESEFLHSHLGVCSSCYDQSQTINAAVREMRNEVVYANPVMVRATQLRVRVRAAKLRQNEESRRPLWISSALALVWALMSMPLLWQGFA